MPGYYVHLASTNQVARRNSSFLKGVEMPDLLKTYLKRYGLVKARKRYNDLKTPDMPDFSFFERRVQEKDNDEENGMHYGSSAKPNFHLFWDSLTEEEKNSPFYRGYLWHLLTDYYAYQTLDLFSDIDINLLHDDWDRINVYIKSFYPDVELPLEVKNLGLVRFNDDNMFNYVDPTHISEIIDYLKTFDMLNDNPDIIMDEIMNKVQEKKSRK